MTWFIFLQTTDKETTDSVCQLKHLSPIWWSSPQSNYHQIVKKGLWSFCIFYNLHADLTVERFLLATLHYTDALCSALTEPFWLVWDEDVQTHQLGESQSFGESDNHLQADLTAERLQLVAQPQRTTDTLLSDLFWLIWDAQLWVKAKSKQIIF